MLLNCQIALRFAICSLFFACVMIGHTVFSFAMITPGSTDEWCYCTPPRPSNLEKIAKILNLPISSLETESLTKIFHGIESRWKTIGLLAGTPFSVLNRIEYEHSDEKTRMKCLTYVMQYNQITSLKQLALAIYMPCGGNSLSKAQDLIMQQARVTHRYVTDLLTRLNCDFLNYLPKKSNHLALRLYNVLNAEIDLASIYYQLYEKRFQANDILIKLDSQFYVGRSEYYNTPNKNHLLLLNGLEYLLRQGVYSWSDIIQAVFAFDGGNDARLAEKLFQRYNRKSNYTFAQFKSDKYLASLPDDKTSTSYSWLTPLNNLCSYLTPFFWRYDHSSTKLVQN